MLSDKDLNIKNDEDYTAEYLLNQSKKQIDKKPRFISFVDLRRIFDTLNITIEPELVEYLIYLMKSSFKDEKASFYYLNYLSFVELLYEENVDDEKSVEEDQSYEITPEAYENILQNIFGKIKSYAKRKGIKPIDIFKDDVALVEEENSKQRFNIIELKDFIEKLDNNIGIDLKELEIYCLYTKLKFDEVENELEAISFKKLENDLNSDEVTTKESKKLKLITTSKEAKNKSVISSQKFNKIEHIDDEENDFISLQGLVFLIKKWLEQGLTLNSLFQTKNTRNLNGKQVLSYEHFLLALSEKKIINKKLKLDEFTDFIIVTESSEDIVIDINSFNSYLSSKLKFEKEDESGVVEIDNSSQGIEIFSGNVSSRINKDREISRRSNKITSNPQNKIKENFTSPVSIGNDVDTKQYEDNVLKLENDSKKSSKNNLDNQIKSDKKSNKYVEDENQDNYSSKEKETDNNNMEEIEQFDIID